MKPIHYWIVWMMGSFALALFLFNMLTGKVSQAALMPGPLSDGHYQFEQNCKVCHVDAFGGKEVLQDACVECHGEQRSKPMDSHPATKFRDPRNAELLQQINALECVTCHAEHRQEITARDGLTQPDDFCVHCHEKIAEDRPSHEGMAFNSCKNSGCHNFHNNRSIYTDFLVKHLDDADTKEHAHIKSREFASVLDELLAYPRDRYPVQALQPADMDAENAELTPEIVSAWHQSRHAAAGVNCSACHLPLNENKEPLSWTDHPGEQACANCHDLELKSFKQGKHGMRLAAELPPMLVKQARLVMKPDSAHASMTCNSCHSDHAYDVKKAATDACLECHDDDHSLAYLDSPHRQLWRKESDGSAPQNSGVSCATCHMPRINVDVDDWVSRILVDHNQSNNLSPNSKMVRSVCLNCHGLDFSLKALADAQQILSNFSTTPALQRHPSMDLAWRDNERYLRETANLPGD